MVTGEIKEIYSENWIDETDYKRPSEVVIDDATNRGLDDLSDTEDATEPTDATKDCVQKENSHSNK